jgi:hypothetical protein
MTRCAFRKTLIYEMRRNHRTVRTVRLSQHSRRLSDPVLSYSERGHCMMIMIRLFTSCTLFGPLIRIVTSFSQPFPNGVRQGIAIKLDMISLTDRRNPQNAVLIATSTHKYGEVAGVVLTFIDYLDTDCTYLDQFDFTRNICQTINFREERSHRASKISRVEICINLCVTCSHARPESRVYESECADYSACTRTSNQLALRPRRTGNSIRTHHS